MKKRILFLLLTLCMLIALVPAVFATGDDLSAQSDNVAAIGETNFATLDAAVGAANDGDEIIILKAAEDANGYRLSTSMRNKEITIKAADGVNVVFDMSSGAVALAGAKLTFHGVTFNYYPNRSYIGIQHTDTMIYNNCTFNGQFFLYGTSETFNNCVFNQNAAGSYNVWTYGAKNVTFSNCQFNCVGKAVLVYNEGVSATNLTVEDTTFTASAPVEGKAAIEIDTSLMPGQTKVTVDQQTAEKVTGFGTGSNSNNSLWNDKKQTEQTNKNTTVIVADEAVFEPACVDLDTFIKLLEASDYTYDGTLANGKKLTVKWSPVSGCFDSLHMLENCAKKNATGNTPKRVNSNLAQFHLFDGKDVAVSVKNVDFVYEPAAVKICLNSGWKGDFTAEQVPSGQLFFLTTGDVTFENCGFDNVVLSTFYTTGTTTIQDCAFENIYNSYAIKDIRGENIIVTGTQIKNCGGGIMLSSADNAKIVKNVNISDNVFEDVDVAGTAAEGKVGTRALIQIASSGDYTNAQIILDGNTSENCGPVLRQLNQSVADHDILTEHLRGDLAGLGGSLTYTSDSTKKASDTEPAQPTIYTVTFADSDIADMKVVKDTAITLPAPTRSGYTFLNWAADDTTYVAGAEYTVTVDVTFTAQWHDDTPAPDPVRPVNPMYAVSAASNVTGGTIKLSPRYAQKGDTVTITATPDKGYMLGKLTVTDNKGNTVKLTSKGGDKYTFVMPRGGVTVDAKFVPAVSFEDVSRRDYFYDAVNWAVENGITTGTSDSRFSPDAPCTRAQVVTFLWRAAGSPKVSGGNPFADVSTSDYYYDAVLWAVRKGITVGTGDGKFSPDATVTRGQTAAFLYRAAGEPAAYGSSFTDVAATAYYADAVSWAAREGITGGTGDGKFSPDAPCTRAQIVTFLYRQYA